MPGLQKLYDKEDEVDDKKKRAVYLIFFLSFFFLLQLSMNQRLRAPLQLLTASVRRRTFVHGRRLGVLYRQLVLVLGP